MCGSQIEIDRIRNEMLEELKKNPHFKVRALCSRYREILEKNQNKK